MFLAFSAFLFVYCFVWMEYSQLKSMRVIPAKVTPKAVNDGSLITLKFSPFVIINEIISWKFHLHTCYQSIFVATWNFWLFHKIDKFEFGLILEVNFLKIGFLEASSPNFPLSSPESVPGSAKIISWTFGIRKNISFEILKVLKLGGPWRFFKI